MPTLYPKPGNWKTARASSKPAKRVVMGPALIRLGRGSTLDTEGWTVLRSGVEVHVARDAVSSRTEENRELGIHKMEQAGAVVTSVETALFELVGRADTDVFKRVQKLVLEYAPNPELAAGSG